MWQNLLTIEFGAKTYDLQPDLAFLTFVFKMVSEMMFTNKHSFITTF